MVKHIEFRLAGNPDVEAIAGLVSSDAFRVDGTGAVLPLSSAEIDFLVTAQRFHVACDADRVVGCVSTVEYEGLIELRSLVVDAGYRSRGIGHELIRLSVDKAARLGYAELFALAGKDGLHAFTRSGFRVQERPPAKMTRDCALCPLLDNGCNESAVVVSLLDRPAS